ncbi:MAG: bestrophin family protein [Saprospiraceae bacterium]
MFVQKTLSFKGVMIFTGGHIIWLTIWVTTVMLCLEYFDLNFLHIPPLPLSLIGTAVAFYIGFKNNQAYDRLWEARKIWGAIVNSSRAWGSTIKGFISNQFADEQLNEEQLHEIKKTLIYRHIAWLYTLRNQLLIPTQWEHISQNKHISKKAETYRKRIGIGLIDDGQIEKILKNTLPKDEYTRLINYKNTATQIIDTQAQHLQELRYKNLINDFGHTELQKILYDFYVHQGKAERIKKFPLPRQYGGMSIIFVGIFIFLLPFGLYPVFRAIYDSFIWFAIPITVLVAWVYLVMELIGDYSENPFEGMGNDIPMLALSRVIEIDLREMLGETNLPPNIEVKNGVLM